MYKVYCGNKDVLFCPERGPNYVQKFDGTRVDIKNMYVLQEEPFVVQRKDNLESYYQNSCSDAGVVAEFCAIDNGVRIWDAGLNRHCWYLASEFKETNESKKRKTVLYKGIAVKIEDDNPVLHPAQWVMAWTCFGLFIGSISAKEITDGPILYRVKKTGEIGSIVYRTHLTVLLDLGSDTKRFSLTEVEAICPLEELTIKWR